MSPKSEAKGIEALEALLAERRKHEGYLAKLEERRAATPAHVFARLRDEYVTKLTDLQVRAAAEAESLSSGIETEEAAVEEIEARLAAVVEERIEGELRAEVGEYEPKEWSKKQTVLNATISQLEKERDARAGVFERTRTLLTEATGYAPPKGAPASASGTPAHRPSSPRMALPDPGAPSTDHPASGPSKAQPMTGPSFDELAFLNSVVGRVSAPAPMPPAPRTPTPTRPQAENAAPVAPPAAPRPTPPPAVVAPAVPAEAPAAVVPAQPAAPEPAPVAAPIAEPSTAPRGPSTAAPKVQMPPPSFSAPPPSVEDEPPSPLGRPTPRTSQAIKTLKCQECGTLNYPTEWYCERCGGELAAL